MSKSNIEWTQETWNPVVGCSILSPGCTNCYAMNMAARIEAMNAEARESERATGKPRASAFHYDGTTKKVNGHAVWTGKVARAPENVRLAPLKRKKPTMYFVNSMSDLFHEDIPDEWIDEVFAVMALTPQHTYQLLTKRAERMRDYLSDRAPEAGRINPISEAMLTMRPDAWKQMLPLAKQWPLDNVWLGVSTERQQEADERIPLLLQTPAAVRFISAEPLLGPIDLGQHLKAYACHDCFNGRTRTTGHFFDEKCPACNGTGCEKPRLDWVITGGESGPNARPSHPQWFRDIRDPCAADGVPYFHKQNGEWIQRSYVNVSRDHGAFNADGSFDGDLSWPVARELLKTHVVMERAGKKRAGRLLDGRTHDDMPSPPDHVITPARRAAAAG